MYFLNNAGRSFLEYQNAKGFCFGVVEKIDDKYVTYVAAYKLGSQRAANSRQICAVLGPCAGGAAYSPAIMDFIFTVKNISQMYITDPKVIKEVIGENVTMEELGGSQIHSHVNGNADFEYDSEAECLKGIIRHGAKLLYAFAEASVPKGNIRDILTM